MILSPVKNGTAGYFVEALVLGQYKLDFLVVKLTGSRQKNKTWLQDPLIACDSLLISTVPP